MDLISAVLDFIRANLANVLATWGPESPQYESARDIMQAYLAENVRRIKDTQVEDSEIDDLMAGLSLGNNGGGKLGSEPVNTKDRVLDTVGSEDKASTATTTTIAEKAGEMDVT